MVEVLSLVTIVKRFPDWIVLSLPDLLFLSQSTVLLSHNLGGRSSRLIQLRCEILQIRLLFRFVAVSGE